MGATHAWANLAGMDTEMLTPAAAAAAASSPAPSRSIRLDGASNFRDLGGYAGLDGRRVRWRTLFRADHLAGLSAADLDVLHGLKLARSADFRGKMESAHLEIGRASCRERV